MKRQRRGDSAEYALTQTQVKTLLSVCRDTEEKVTIGMMVFCGLRISELTHMRADWITQDGNLRIPNSQACNCAECARVRGNEWRPKTKAGARTLPIPQRMRKDLVELFKAKPYGLGVSRIGLYSRTKTILRRAKVKIRGSASDIPFPHALRATCASMLAAGGMSAAHLSYFMGWKSIAIGDHYIRLSTAKNGALKQAREIFG